MNAGAAGRQVEAPAAGGPRPAPGPRLIWTALLLVLAAVIASGAWSLLRDRAAARGGPKILGELPDFSLTERDGSVVSKASLLGRVWVADFIFTRCTGVCPLLSTRMSSIAKTLRGRDDVTLVSFSVDPDYDTPEILRRYAEGYGAGAGGGPRWMFLTGPRADMHGLVGEGFHLAVAQAQPGEAAPGELITHSDRFVLVDRLGRIRGYYHGTEEEGPRRLLADLDRVAQER